MLITMTRRRNVILPFPRVELLVDASRVVTATFADLMKLPGEMPSSDKASLGRLIIDPDMEDRVLVKGSIGADRTFGQFVSAKLFKQLVLAEVISMSQTISLEFMALPDPEQDEAWDRAWAAGCLPLDRKLVLNAGIIVSLIYNIQ